MVLSFENNYKYEETCCKVFIPSTISVVYSLWNRIVVANRYICEEDMLKRIEMGAVRWRAWRIRSRDNIVWRMNWNSKGMETTLPCHPHWTDDTREDCGYEIKRDDRRTLFIALHQGRSSPQIVEFAVRPFCRQLESLYSQLRFSARRAGDSRRICW